MILPDRSSGLPGLSKKSWICWSASTYSLILGISLFFLDWKIIGGCSLWVSLRGVAWSVGWALRNERIQTEPKGDHLWKRSEDPEGCTNPPEAPKGLGSWNALEDSSPAGQCSPRRTARLGALDHTPVEVGTGTLDSGATAHYKHLGNWSKHPGNNTGMIGGLWTRGLKWLYWKCRSIMLMEFHLYSQDKKIGECLDSTFTI